MNKLIDGNLKFLNYSYPRFVLNLCDFSSYFSLISISLDNNIET